MSKDDPDSALPPFQVNLGWALASLLRDYQKQVEEALEGLPGGARAFLVMSHVGQQTSQSQIAIAERLALDKTTLTYLLDALEKETLIKRTIDPNDRRSRHIDLTPKGLKALAHFSKSVDKVEQNILARLGGDDAVQFRLFLMKAAGLEHRSWEEVVADEGSGHICQATIGLNAEN